MMSRMQESGAEKVMMMFKAISLVVLARVRAVTSSLLRTQMYHFK